MPSRRLLGLSEAVIVHLISAVFLLGAGGLLLVMDARAPYVGSDFSLPWPALLLALVVVEAMSVTIQHGKERQDMSLTELPLVAGLALVAPAELAAAVFVAMVVSKPWLVRQPHRLLFNGSVRAFDTVCAVLVFRAVVDPGAQPGPQLWVGGLLAAMTAAVVSTAVVTMTIGLVVERISARELVRHLGLALLPAVASGALGVLALSIAFWDPHALWLLAIPVGAFFVLHRRSEEARVHHDRMRALYETGGSVRAAGTAQEAVAALLSGAREMFGADVACVTLAGDGHEPVQFVDRGDGLEEREGAAVPPSSLPRILRRRDVEATAGGARHALVAPMVEGDRVVGEVHVARTRAAARAYRAADLRIFETLIDHAAVTIERGRMQHRAYHDPLTGLANRTVFSRPAPEPAPDALVGVIYMDLDDFKAINDDFGHAVGDALLRAVAGRMRRCLRQGDVPVRLGGDEFAVVLTDAVNRDEALAAAQRLLDGVQQPYRLDGRELHVRASLGVALAPAAEKTLEQLLDEADAAMYRAKSAGKGRVSASG